MGGEFCSSPFYHALNLRLVIVSAPTGSIYMLIVCFTLDIYFQLLFFSQALLIGDTRGVRSTPLFSFLRFDMCQIFGSMLYLLWLIKFVTALLFMLVTAPT